MRVRYYGRLINNSFSCGLGFTQDVSISVSCVGGRICVAHCENVARYCVWIMC